MIDKLIRNNISQKIVCDDNFVKLSEAKFTEHINTIKPVSRNSTLWLNLLQQIHLMLNFVIAERTGNWKLHLETTTDKLPYFHAAGHIPYAKSAHLYVQQIEPNIIKTV